MRQLAKRGVKTYVKDREDIFTVAESRDLLWGDIDVVFAESFGNTEADSKRQKESNEPRQENDPIIPGNSFDNKIPRYHASEDENRGKDQSSRRDGKDGRSTIRHRTTRF